MLSVGIHKQVILDEDWNIIVDDEEIIAQKRKTRLIERRYTLLKMFEDHEISTETTSSEEILEMVHILHI